MAFCKDCDQEIIWSNTGDCKRIALDATPVKRDDPRFTGSNVWKVYAIHPGGDGGLAKRGTAEDRRLHRNLYTCHFETCPKRTR